MQTPNATSHMTNNTSKLNQLTTYKGLDKNFVGNGKGLQISHIGDTSLTTNHGKLKLKNVLVVPNLKKNLLSIGKLTIDNQCSFEFDSHGFVVKDKDNKVLAKGLRKGNLYALKENKEAALSAIRGTTTNLSIWHQRLGH